MLDKTGAAVPHDSPDRRNHFPSFDARLILFGRIQHSSGGEHKVSHFAMSEPSDSDLRAAVRKMTSHFLVPRDSSHLSGTSGTAASTLREPYRQIGDAFVHNLASVTSTASMPFTLAMAGIHEQHFQRLFAAERIRALMTVDRGDGDDEAMFESRRSRHAANVARQRMTVFSSSEEGRDAITRDICRFLIQSVSDAALARAASELLLQGLVLAWSALEVLVRDTFIALLNEQPKLVERLLQDPGTKKRFDAAKMPMDVLSEYEFDISQHVGTILARQQDFSDLPSIKATLLVLFPDTVRLSEALSRRDLWILSQQRHLIVHRTGLVDVEYIQKTGSTEAMGSRLQVLPEAVEKHMDVVQEAGSALLTLLPRAASQDDSIPSEQQDRG